MYLALKHIHMLFAVLSIAGFILRGIWMLLDSPKLQHKLTKVLPHIGDTVLLASAIGLAVVSQQYPIAEDWLTVKVIGLIAYIALGVFALKRGKTKTIRLACFVLAVGVFFYIAFVARTHQVFPFAGM